jgi:hypothetical protein
MPNHIYLTYQSNHWKSVRPIVWSNLAKRVKKQDYESKKDLHSSYGVESQKESETLIRMLPFNLPANPPLILPSCAFCDVSITRNIAIPSFFTLFCDSIHILFFKFGFHSNGIVSVTLVMILPPRQSCDHYSHHCSAG